MSLLGFRSCNLSNHSPVALPLCHGGHKSGLIFFMVIIYSWLLQPYGVVSQKGLTFLRFEPSSLQSAIQLLSLLAMEGVNQTVYSDKKKLYHWDLNLQPYNLQSSSLTSEPRRSLVQFFWQFFGFETPTC